MRVTGGVCESGGRKRRILLTVKVGMATSVWVLPYQSLVKIVCTEINDKFSLNSGDYICPLICNFTKNFVLES